jgi:hypothetical protein
MKKKATKYISLKPCGSLPTMISAHKDFLKINKLLKNRQSVGAQGNVSPINHTH